MARRPAAGMLGARAVGALLLIVAVLTATRGWQQL
jgi:hypothetical protein